jgi:hypothetical protein
MSGTQSANRDATKVAFLARSRYGSPFVARVPGKPGERGYDPNGKKRMSMLLMVPKTDSATVKRIQAAIDAAIEEEWGQQRPASLRVPITDGDERRSDGSYVRPGDEFRGQMLISIRANEDRMPVVMRGPAGQQVQAYPKDYHPGYWLTTVNRAFVYTFMKTNHGVSLGCNAVNITAEDEVFSSDEPVSDLDAALSGASLLANASPITSGPKEPPPAKSDPTAQFA